jgi:outer membrane protein OmpA-like peptidoglycan-associated protein
MKTATKFFAVLAIMLMAGAVQARAEEQADYPVQKEIEMRQIHPVHMLHGLRRIMPPVAAEENIAPPVQFATGSDKLTPQDQMTVKKVAVLLKSPAYRGRHVMVSGYTDNKGKDAANQRLSYHRAVMVVKALVKQGVPASQLTAQGFGRENPVATNSTAEGRAQNRRVTFTLATE